MSYLNMGAGIGGATLPLAMGAVMDISNVFISFLVLAIASLVAGAYLWWHSKERQ